MSMLTKLVLAGFLAALAVPAVAECVSDHKSASTTAKPVAEKPAETSKPAGG
jgi:hypothetical protein